MPSYLIAGASRGLGYAFLRALALDPTNTVIGLVRNKAATAQQLQADGLNNVHLVTGDITDRNMLAQAAKEVAEITGGGLDVVINNGAYISQITAWSTLAEYERDVGFVVEDMQKSFDANVYGVLNTVYAFLPLIRAGTLKKVIAISSGMGDIDFINETSLAVGVPYAISKAALSVLFAKLGAAYADEGILFMSICPGFVNTEATKTPASEDEASKMEAALAKLNEYTGGTLRPMEPLESARRVLALIEGSKIEDGYGGSFRSHNGTRRWA